MSRKNNLRQYQNIVDGDMSDSEIISDVTNIQWLDNISVQLNFTGTPVGAFYIEVSADHAEDENKNILVSGTWVPIDLFPVPVASGAADTILIDLNQLATPWIRVRYARTSGSGTLNGFISGKML